MTFWERNFNLFSETPDTEVEYAKYVCYQLKQNKRQNIHISTYIYILSMMPLWQIKMFNFGFCLLWILLCIVKVINIIYEKKLFYQLSIKGNNPIIQNNTIIELQVYYSRKWYKLKTLP